MNRFGSGWDYSPLPLNEEDSRPIEQPEWIEPMNKIDKINKINEIDKMNDDTEANQIERDDIEQVEEGKDYIAGLVLDDDNQPTDRVVKIKISDITSPDCWGGCGSTFARCGLLEKNCINWECRKLECVNQTGYVRRLKTIDQPRCQICGRDLIKARL